MDGFFSRIFQALRKCRGTKNVLDENHTVHIGVPSGRTNEIHTTKYTLISFLPLFLFDQFTQFTNIFFVVISIIQARDLSRAASNLRCLDRNPGHLPMGHVQLYPGTSPFGWQSTSVPLATIILFAACKELWEDHKRAKSDRRTNHQLVQAQEMLTGEWRDVAWTNLQAGQLIYVTKGNFFPADLVLLSSSEPAGLAYIETSNLDGETNLKVRRALPVTAGAVTKEAISELMTGIVLQCEKPNKNLYDFRGEFLNLFEKISQTDQATTGTQISTILDKSQFLQRGARLRNTDWVLALVVYAGRETKFMLNSIRTQMKQSRMNVLVSCLMMMQFGALLLLTSWFVFMTRSERKSENFAEIMLTNATNVVEQDPIYLTLLFFLIAFAGLVPISLYITIQTIQLAQSALIRSDLEIYDGKTDTPAEIRSSKLTSELGEISYIMADKTGTLTRNLMLFKNCSVGGIKYGSRKTKSFNPKVMVEDLKSDFRKNAPDLRHFITACAICHTVVPERKEEKVIFHASSPDEQALVEFAEQAGFKFHTRTPTRVEISETIGEKPVNRTWEVLEIIEFDSICKRMGVITRDEEGKIHLYVKGADSAILSTVTEEEKQNVDRLKSHLSDFAKKGLRTLCFAERSMALEEYTGWAANYEKLREGSMSSEIRLEKQHEMETGIIKNMHLIGASAIEDKLQEKVSDTINRILSAGIRMWVLTGDKLETAINIGFSCRLLSQNVTLLVLQTTTREETEDVLRTWISQVGNTRMQKGLRAATIVESTALDFILADEGLKSDFLRIALASHAVLCCRCTPLQKASVTKMVRKFGTGCVLAIGDGGNDIAMIQEADVGVGIYGREGNQAAISADFSISQFRFLDRLLFIHGTLSLYRTNKTVLYTIYKNVLDVSLMAWYCVYTGFSTQVYTDSIHFVGYNMWYTCLPPLAMGIFDRPMSLQQLHSFPANYRLMQKSFKFSKYFMMIAIGFLHSFAVFYAVKNWYGTHYGTTSHDGREMNLNIFGFTLHYTMVWVANMRLLLMFSAPNWLTIGSIIISLFAPLLIMVQQSLLWKTFMMQWNTAASYGMAPMLFSVGPCVLLLLVVIALAIPDIVNQHLRQALRKIPVMEKWKAKQAPAKLLEPLVRVADLIRNKHNATGYAFAQDDGTVLSQSIVMKAYDSRAPKQAGVDLTNAMNEEEKSSRSSKRSSKRGLGDKTVDCSSPCDSRTGLVLNNAQQSQKEKTDTEGEKS